MKKTITVDFHQDADTVPGFLGITDDRAHEIEDELTQGAMSNQNRNKDIEDALNKYDDAEAVWALFLLVPVEANAEFAGAALENDNAGTEDEGVSDAE